MNEIDTIRAQLRVEAQHALAVARTATGDEGNRRRACAAYLEWVLGAFAERERRLAGLLDAPGAPEPVRRALGAALRAPGSSTEALATLHAARADHVKWGELARFLEGDWQARRDALDAALAPHRRIAEWRTALGVRAEGILRERELYARVVES